MRSQVLPRAKALVSSLARTLEATCAWFSEVTPETYEAHVLALVQG